MCISDVMSVSVTWKTRLVATVFVMLLLKVAEHKHSGSSSSSSSNKSTTTINIFPFLMQYVSVLMSARPKALAYFVHRLKPRTALPGTGGTKSERTFVDSYQL